MKFFVSILLCSFLLSSNLFAKKGKSKKKNEPITKILKSGLPLNSQWILESIAKEFNTLKSIYKNSYITIESSKTAFRGNAGCNSISGQLTTNNNSIKFSNIIRTEMYCDSMPQEDLFLVLIEMATNYKIVGGELFLFKKEKLLMTLESYR